MEVWAPPLFIEVLITSERQCILECRFCLFLQFFDKMFSLFRKVVICFYQFHPLYPCLLRGRRGRDRMVVGFTTTRPISNVGVRTPFIAKCNRYNIMWYSLSVTCGRSVDFCLYSTNKTDSNDITDILLKMALNTINQTKENLACHNIIDITKISQLYYYLGYTIRYIMLKVSVHLIHNA
jgi:hypothetical protein